MYACTIIASSNDPVYIPKSKRSKGKEWVRERINMVSGVIHNKIIQLEIYLQGKYVKRPKVRRHNPIGRYQSAKVVCMTALAMQATSNNYITNTTFDSDSSMIGIDNRCSACMSHVIEDFTGQMRECNKSIKGFGGSKVYNVKIGTIIWRWEDDEGKIHKFTIPNLYYVPDGNVRLLSPQHWAKTQYLSIKMNERYGTMSQTTDKNITLFWNKKKNKLTVPLSKESNVGSFHLAPGFNKFMAFCSKADMDNDETPIICMEATNDKTMDFKVEKSSWTNNETENIFNHGQSNDNMKKENTNKNIKSTESEKAAEVLQLHYRLGHISFEKMRVMAKMGTIDKRFAKYPKPECAACAYAKLTKRQWRNKVQKNYTNYVATQPGEIVSVDQMISPVPGLVAQITGKLTNKRYKCATIYVDHASRFGYVYLQKTATAEETIEGKEAFEAVMRLHNISVKAYHADNGIFKANKWVENCKVNRQRLTFAGVNAHHQNGIAERRIRELQDSARSMILHANKRWPNTITTNLWPYAMKMACEVFNNSPNLSRKDYKTPVQVLSNTDISINPKHYNTFGCPVYVLNSKLQEGKPFGKWKQRSRVGVYLGQSPHHNKNVALILDRTSGYVSPQFHVKFDNYFESIMDDTHDSEWKVKAGFISQREREKILKNVDKIPTIIPGIERRYDKKAPEYEKHKNKDVISNSEGVDSKHISINKLNERKSLKRKHNEIVEDARKSKQDNKADKKVHFEDDAQPKSTDGLRRSARLNPSLKEGYELVSLQAKLMRQDHKMDIPGELFCKQAFVVSEEEQYDMMALKATTDPDTMYMHEAMKEKDKAKFIEAMQKEVRDQYENGNFEIVHISKVPTNSLILPAVWQMKRKRDIKTRKIKKYKARLNINGSRMLKGVHYDETYAPVASWNSIRILLILVAAFGWHTQQIDYVLAFPQAPVEKEIYMKIPKGFELNYGSPNEYVLKLKRNIYGQKQAGRVWNKYLEKKLIEEVGFTKSKVDECVFYKKNTMYILYTDDSILAGPNKNEIDEIIEEIKRAKLDITREGDIQDFLGINIQKKKNGDIKLSQPHLIDQILKDLKMDKDELKMKDIPCMTSKILSSGKDSDKFDNSFHYRSIIGKLNYLEKGTRSDISYITHQCARFTHSPKMVHAKAIRWLARYLKSTRTKGFIIKPDLSKGMEVYVDADFSGNWNRKDSEHVDSARSRHGYIIKFMNCPIIWKSQMQTEIALSSCESEYTGLSYALRDAIPIMNLLNEIKNKSLLKKFETPKIFCKVFEDNSGALEMAKVHKYRPRTKHLNVKLHHFRSYVNNGSIQMHSIDTKDQQADYLTKPVTIEVLRKLRKLVMGW